MTGTRVVWFSIGVGQGGIRRRRTTACSSVMSVTLILQNNNEFPQNPPLHQAWIYSGNVLLWQESSQVHLPERSALELSLEVERHGTVENGLT